jgi:hypothetical protein
LIYFIIFKAERSNQQKEFLDRLKPHLEEFPKVHTNSKGTRSMILIVPSKLLTEKANKNNEQVTEIEETEEPNPKDDYENKRKKSV